MFRRGKKLLAIVVMVVGLFLCVGGIGYASISGVCSNCHTMHNSQNGVGEVETYSNGSLSTAGDTPQDQLLKASCIACHTGTSASDKTNSHNAPIVLHTSEPSGQGAGNTLAGGDFYWVATGLGATDSKGHNVAGINSEDAAIGKTPPGWDASATPGALSDGSIAENAPSWTNQLTCAGTYGCHGKRTSTDPDVAMKGAHHGNIGGTATVATSPSTIGDSYRFLGGIKGLENSEWNWAETASTHNEYYGIAGNTDYSDKSTISYSCSQCHGNLHKTIGNSPWTRHPTDIVLPASGEYASYNPDGTTAGEYSLEAPVARGAVPSSSNALVTPGSTTETGATVMCLSCHRAHGSSEPDILRWTYSGMVAGAGTDDNGCFTCHTSKNAD